MKTYFINFRGAFTLDVHCKRHFIFLSHVMMEEDRAYKDRSLQHISV